MANTTMPAVWVGCQAAYNAGKLHGEWIDVVETGPDADSLQDRIDAVLRSSPEPGAEEWAVMDSEGFGGLDCDGMSPRDICEIAEAICEADEQGIPAEVVAYVVRERPADWSTILPDGVDVYDEDTLADMAHEWAEEAGTPTWVLGYLDGPTLHRMGEDMIRDREESFYLDGCWYVMRGVS